MNLPKIYPPPLDTHFPRCIIQASDFGAAMGIFIEGGTEYLQVNKAILVGEMFFIETDKEGTYGITWDSIHGGNIAIPTPSPTDS